MTVKRDLMTMKELIEILRRRGFRLELKREGHRVVGISLRGSKDDATPALMRVLAFYRNDIIEHLKGEGN